MTFLVTCCLFLLLHLIFIKCINKICCSRAAGGAGVQQQGEAVQGALRAARDGRAGGEVLLLQLQPLQQCSQGEGKH